MQPDPIVEEVRKARYEYGAKFNHDLEAIFRDLQEQERKSGRTYVNYPPKRVSPEEQAAAAARLRERANGVEGAAADTRAPG